MIVVIILLVIIATGVLFVVLSSGDREGRESGGNSAKIKVNGEEYKIDVSKIDDKYIADLDRQLQIARMKNKQWASQAEVLYGFQQSGMEAEKHNDITTAIEQYEKAVNYGREASQMNINQYYHSIERLVVLYRRQKEYSKEIETINNALKEKLQSKARDYLIDRLQKSKVLMDKSK